MASTRSAQPSPLTPFLKWVGGKTQLMDQLMSRFPSKMESYYEPFVGGGSVLLALLNRVRAGELTVAGRIVACDANSLLINVFVQIRDHPGEVHSAINEIVEKYRGIAAFKGSKTPGSEEVAMSSKESYYYWLRRTFTAHSQLDAQKAAMFIVLNKLCFRGVFRMGPNGFNVPFGHYVKTPQFPTRERWLEYSQAFARVEFICQDFETTLAMPRGGDFVYLDPPYVPVTATSFVGYTEGGFSSKQHETLFGLARGLMPRGIAVLMSNSDAPIVHETFRDFAIEKVLARRAINSRNPDSKCFETLVTNPIPETNQ